MSDRQHSACFMQNRQCECFPCHEGIDQEDFNCLFCFCPLYALGKKCGGQYRYNDKGRKVCADCTFPHRKESYEKILKRYEEIMAVVHMVDSAP